MPVNTMVVTDPLPILLIPSKLTLGRTESVLTTEGCHFHPGLHIAGILRLLQSPQQGGVWLYKDISGGWKFFSLLIQVAI